MSLNILLIRDYDRSEGTNSYNKENCSKILFIGTSLISVDWKYTWAWDLTCGSAGKIAGMGLGATGQEHCGCHRKSAPRSHQLLFNRASGESPCDALSTGFCKESACFYCEAAATSCIAATWFATKVSRRLLSFQRYPKTQVLLSVQNTDLSTFMSVSVLMILSNLAATTAALNSNWGIVRSLSGVFVMRRYQQSSGSDKLWLCQAA